MFLKIGALYIAEISRPNLRGTFGNCQSLSVAFGITFAMICGALMNWRYEITNQTTMWKIMTILSEIFTWLQFWNFCVFRYLSITCSIPPLFGGLVLLMVPESPYYLSQKGHTQASDRALKWLMVNSNWIRQAEEDISEFLKSSTSAREKGMCRWWLHIFW